MKTYEEMIARLAELYDFAERYRSQHVFEMADGFCYAVAFMFGVEETRAQWDAAHVILA